jgi:ribosomal protein S18 acetylase RimI-like enzyme
MCRELGAFMTQTAIEIMSGDFIVWRCLHGGALTTDSIEQWGGQADLPWGEFRARNVPLLTRLTEVYGACAILARANDRVVGHLRFYPKAVCEMAEPGPGLCVQQEFPSGPSRDFAERRFPPLDEIQDKTIVVHCMMVAPGAPESESSHRKGIGSRMARRLVEWAGENGWRRIEATAYEDLDLIYTLTGQAGKSFWEKLGFHVAEVGVESYFAEANEHTKILREQAVSRGLPPDAVQNKYTMRLDLA